MPCTRCGSTAPPVAGVCTACGAGLPDEAVTAQDAPVPAETIVLPSFEARETGATQLPREAPRSAGLQVGQTFGARYHIIRLLGAGGMGAVYQAWDQVLEVAVALKVIRPEAAADPATADALRQRFKHELLLARQVTHPNVVRIHDIGEIDGISYISMPYVQGSDLASILKREGRQPVERVVAIARELAGGLAAAHDAGVVHRDLKPANVMIDNDGGVLIMDFGIARSTAASARAVTESGAIVGTVEYMSPEQARAEPVDARADIYSFGLILNDLLLGRRQGRASGVAELMARINQAPASPRSIDPTIPAALDALVVRCVQPDPAARCQNMAEVIAALNAMDAHGEAKAGAASGLRSWPRRRLALVAAALVALVVAGGWLVRARLSRSAASQAGGPAVSLAILPFRNASGDVTLDAVGASLSDVLTTELGQSARARTIAPDRVRQVLHDLRFSPNAALSPTELARIADLTGARRVLWGQLSRFGNAVRIDATFQDLDRGESLPLNAMAPNDAALLTAVGQLADSVRQTLARGSPELLNELKSTAWRPSTSSIEALRSYDEGLRLTQSGQYQEALDAFKAATKQDENFALAWAGVARSYSTLGYDTEAADASRRAMSLAGGLSPQERYRVEATSYQVTNDAQKAIEAYENLSRAAANDVMVQYELGNLYEQAGQLDRAHQQFARVVDLDPKFAEGLRALGRVEIKQGDPQASLEPLNKALTISVELDNDEVRANTLQAIGVAFKRMGRPQEALRRYQESLEIKRRLGQKRGTANSLVEIAQVQEALGHPEEAKQSYGEALGLQREIGDKAGIATTLVNLAGLLDETMGRPDDALPLFREALTIRREIGTPDDEALVLNNIGTAYLTKGQYSDAQTYFERALDIRQKTKDPGAIADTLHNLGETLADMGQYDQALKRYLGALELRRSSGDRRAAAIESYSVGRIFDYQGRYGAAVKSKEDALTAYRALKQRDIWLGEIAGGYGHSLNLAGRFDAAGKAIDEAMAVAHELNNPVLTAQATQFQTERALLSGDVKAAANLAAGAQQAAEHAGDRRLELLARMIDAETTAATAPSAALAAKVQALAQQAESLGLAAVSADGAALRAEVLLAVGDRRAARQAADFAVAKSEGLGLRVAAARAHYVRARVLQAAKDPSASREYAAALRPLEEIRNEDGGADALKRADLAPMYQDCLAQTRPR
jgi:tetratricopeptide (TPR) repeat protein/TolB-like protein